MLFIFKVISKIFLKFKSKDFDSLINIPDTDMDLIHEKRSDNCAVPRHDKNKIWIICRTQAHFKGTHEIFVVVVLGTVRFCKRCLCSIMATQTFRP